MNNTERHVRKEGFFFFFKKIAAKKITQFYKTYISYLHHPLNVLFVLIYISKTFLKKNNFYFIFFFALN
jgi:hypothetical protein